MRKPYYIIPVIATILTGCTDQRDYYNNKDDCLKDWQEKQCDNVIEYTEDEFGNSTVIPKTTSYVGPPYNSDTPRTAINGFRGSSPIHTNSVTVMRGGFGHSGTYHAFGGGS